MMTATKAWSTTSQKLDSRVNILRDYSERVNNVIVAANQTGSEFTRRVANERYIFSSFLEAMPSAEEYGKENDIDFVEGLEMFFTSLEKVGHAFTAFAATLHFHTNEPLKTLAKDMTALKESVECQAILHGKQLDQCQMALQHAQEKRSATTNEVQALEAEQKEFDELQKQGGLWTMFNKKQNKKITSKLKGAVQGKVNAIEEVAVRAEAAKLAAQELEQKFVELMNAMQGSDSKICKIVTSSLSAISGAVEEKVDALRDAANHSRRGSNIVRHILNLESKNCISPEDMLWYRNTDKDAISSGSGHMGNPFSDDAPLAGRQKTTLSSRQKKALARFRGPPDFQRTSHMDEARKWSHSPVASEEEKSTERVLRPANPEEDAKNRSSKCADRHVRKDEMDDEDYDSDSEEEDDYEDDSSYDYSPNSRYVNDLTTIDEESQRAFSHMYSMELDPAASPKRAHDSESKEMFPNVLPRLYSVAEKVAMQDSEQSFCNGAAKKKEQPPGPPAEKEPDFHPSSSSSAVPHEDVLAAQAARTEGEATSSSRKEESISRRSSLQSGCFENGPLPPPLAEPSTHITGCSVASGKSVSRGSGVRPPLLEPHSRISGSSAASSSSGAPPPPPPPPTQSPNRQNGISSARSGKGTSPSPDQPSLPNRTIQSLSDGSAKDENKTLNTGPIVFDIASRASDVTSNVVRDSLDITRVTDVPMSSSLPGVFDLAKQDEETMKEEDKTGPDCTPGQDDDFVSVYETPTAEKGADASGDSAAADVAALSLQRAASAELIAEGVDNVIVSHPQEATSSEVIQLENKDAVPSEFQDASQEKIDNRLAERGWPSPANTEPFRDDSLLPLPRSNTTSSKAGCQEEPSPTSSREGCLAEQISPSESPKKTGMEKLDSVKEESLRKNQMDEAAIAPPLQQATALAYQAPTASSDFGNDSFLNQEKISMPESDEEENLKSVENLF